jgi:hypothetical protein
LKFCHRSIKIQPVHDCISDQRKVLACGPGRRPSFLSGAAKTPNADHLQPITVSLAAQRSWSLSHSIETIGQPTTHIRRQAGARRGHARIPFNIVFHMGSFPPGIPTSRVFPLRFNMCVRAEACGRSGKSHWEAKACPKRDREGVVDMDDF